MQSTITHAIKGIVKLRTQAGGCSRALRINDDILLSDWQGLIQPRAGCVQRQGVESRCDRSACDNQHTSTEIHSNKKDERVPYSHKEQSSRPAPLSTWSAMRSARLPCLSLLTPMMRPGILRARSTRHDIKPAWGPPKPRGMPKRYT